jgi:hypothetical protein
MVRRRRRVVLCRYPLPATRSLLYLSLRSSGHFPYAHRV